MIAIRCTLLRDVFEGGRPDDPRRAEWPPSWMRLFSALVSVADPGSPDDAVLEALETAAPPLILAAEYHASRRAAFVPTNVVLNKQGGHTVLAGRTNSERMWARAAPRSSRLWYQWPSLELPSERRHRLHDLCRRVPYVGRSTSPAVVELRDDPPEGNWMLPADAVEPGEFRLAQPIRSPFPGALAALREAHEEKHVDRGAGAPWQIGRGIDYGYREPTTIEGDVAGPYLRVVVLRHEGRRLDGRHTVRVTHAVRRALMSRAQRPLETLHGHHGGDVVQCAIASLPDVGHEHADGHILGVAICLPDLTPDEFHVLGEAIPAVGKRLEVTTGPLGVLYFERLPPLDARRHAFALRPDRWGGPSRRWVTALPMVLDRYLKSEAEVEEEVRRAVRNSLLPEPAIISISRRPLLRGGIDLRPVETLRRPSDRGVKPYRHVALEFPTPVQGPVLVGSMRHYGLGLCFPLHLQPMGAEAEVAQIREREGINDA